MNRIHSLVLLLFIPAIAFAQPERHELGRRLRLFEEAWETQKDVGIRKEPAANMNTAVMSFFSLKLGEAARALDQGTISLLKSDNPSREVNLRCLWLKADSHWVELNTRKLKVQIDRFYSLEKPQLNNVGYAYQWVPSQGHIDANAVVGFSQTLTFTDIPRTIEIDIPQKEGDYVLSWKWHSGGEQEYPVSSKYFVVSVSRNRDQRLAQIKEAVAKRPTPYATSDEVSVSLNVKVLERLAKGETLEAHYPADRLLTECEEAVAAIARKEPYYHTGKVGQFWMGVRTPIKNIVPLRIQTVAVKPGQKVPVVLALHGAGGSENLFFDGYGNGKVARFARERGWFVVAPRSSLTKAGHAETIAELAKVFPEIDTNQVFVVGHSMGAAEAIREANAMPGKFAAIAALGGGGSPKPAKDQTEAFNNLPFYVGVGENDFANTQAEALSKNLKKAGVESVTFKRYPGIEHMIIVQEALPEVFQFFEDVQKAKTKLSGCIAALNHRLIAMTPPGSVALESPIEAKLERVTRIWDKYPHSAFTDLIWWKDRFICVFRTGAKHVSDDGTIQMLSSEDGQHWDRVIRFTASSGDLRDPKLGIGPTNELYVYAAVALRDKTQHTHQSVQWNSDDGKNWPVRLEIGEPDSWLWRVTRHKSGYYGWGYGTNKERFIRLYKSPTGHRFEPITPKLLADKGYPNETAMIMEGDQAWCLLRRDGKAPLNTALLGTAKVPFTEWTWRDLGVQIGGPALLRLPSEQFLATIRLYDAPKVRTALCQLDVEQGKLKELLTLPSSGDSSYAGMVWHQQKLWISYYSSHEGKSSIYFAEIDIKQE